MMGSLQSSCAVLLALVASCTAKAHRALITSQQVPTISVNTTLLASSGSYVNVSWSGIANPTPYDAVRGPACTTANMGGRPSVCLVPACDVCLQVALFLVGYSPDKIRPPRYNWVNRSPTWPSGSGEEGCWVGWRVSRQAQDPRRCELLCCCASRRVANRQFVAWWSCGAAGAGLPPSCPPPAPHACVRLHRQLHLLVAPRLCACQSSSSLHGIGQANLVCCSTHTFLLCQRSCSFGYWHV